MAISTQSEGKVQRYLSAYGVPLPRTQYVSLQLQLLFAHCGGDAGQEALGGLVDGVDAGQVAFGVVHGVVQAEARQVGIHHAHREDAQRGGV